MKVPSFDNFLFYDPGYVKEMRDLADISGMKESAKGFDNLLTALTHDSRPAYQPRQPTCEAPDVPAVVTPTDASILTSLGVLFYFDEPHKHPFHIEEIAHALSNLCRFTGHTSRFYSVAQHSVIVSNLVPPEMAMMALLHDGVEAYVGDMASPLKRLVPQYRAIEDRVERALMNAFDLPFPLHPEVKRADLLALDLERVSLMPPNPQWQARAMFRASDVPKIKPLRPAKAKRLFLERYEELRGA